MSDVEVPGAAPGPACECKGLFPYRSSTGHHPSCPVHCYFVAPHAYRPPAFEDRGTAHWVWWLAGRREARFEPFPEATEVVELSVPIGWSLRPDPGSGVALVSTFGERLAAGQALARAAGGDLGGFRVRRVVGAGAAGVGA